MATAQQLLVDQFVASINANTNLNSTVIASSPHAGILRVTSKTADGPRIAYNIGGSSVTGAGTFDAKAATGSPPYAELWFSWTLAPGDTVKINVTNGVRSLDLTENLPLATTVDAGGFDHTGYTPGGSAGGVAVGGSGIGSARHRRLVVMECGSASTSFGSMFALDPQDATGVAIPTFRVVQSLPAAGSSQGESVYVTATRQGYVWDGTGWRDITASPIRSYSNDAQLQADGTQAIGTYAVSSDTGNMYVMTSDGWRRIGIVEFNTYNDMLAWDAAIGTEAISRDLDVLFLRVEDAAHLESWIPISQLVRLEADILTTQNVPGLTAVATDTGKRFVNNGTRWVQDPIEHYPTEADLLAATPIDGHLAWADDTSVVFTATGGAWNRLQGPQVTYGTTAPTTPGTGDFWYDSRTNRQTLNIWTGTDWKSASGVTIGGTGAKVILPGYFNEDPSDTATADDIGGLAFKYNGAAKQLWLNKGTSWSAMTPMLGVPANEGKVLKADSSGNAVWSPDLSPFITNFTSTEQHPTGDQGAWHKGLGARPQHWIKFYGTGECNANTRLMLIMQRNGGWYNWQSDWGYGQAMTSYEANGLREEDAAIKADWWRDNAGGRVTEDNGSYKIGANRIWVCEGQIFLGHDRTVFHIKTTYTSDNGTPMVCEMRVKKTAARKDINDFGFKYMNGAGWFDGWVEYN